MIYTEKELVNLHKCTVYKLDLLTQLNDDKLMQFGEETKRIVAVNNASDFGYGMASPKVLELYGRTQEELFKTDTAFLLERMHPESASRILPALTSFYYDFDRHTTFTDIQVVRGDIHLPYLSYLKSSKIGHNGNLLTFSIPLSDLGTFGKKAERELEISQRFQAMLPQFLLLTKREKEILALIGMGLTNTEISDKLLCSSHTARTHRMKIYKKLDISSLKEAIQWALTFGLV